MYSVSVCLLISIYNCVLAIDGRVIEDVKDTSLVKESSPLNQYWKEVMSFNKTAPLLSKYLQSNFGPKLVSTALSNSLSGSKGMSDESLKNGRSPKGLDFRRMPELENSVGQTLTWGSRRRGGGFGDFGSSGQERFGGHPGGQDAGWPVVAGGGVRETGGSVYFRGPGAMVGEGGVVGKGRGGGRAGGGSRAGAGAGAAANAASGADDNAKVQSAASSQAAATSQSSNGESKAMAASSANSQSSNGKSQAISVSSANSQSSNGDSGSISNSQSMSVANSESGQANSQSQAMSASVSAANGQSAAFSAASAAAMGQGLAASQAMSSAASFSAGQGGQSMSASSSQSAAMAGADNNGNSAFSSSASMSMASSNLLGAEADNNEFKMNFKTPLGTANIDEKIPIMRWKEQYSRWSSKSHKENYRSI
ncbi:spidroin-1-like isoform X1 [Nilaparvata lugens]|uniref:spidroin-1-like isoform X1 n=1 Tax=Nilaparvata lugens TaxID=108931 RepID=UPI00193E8F1F|nr:spidroin-1-like isoform X1 [Nilaparvata lugens]